MLHVMGAKNCEVQKSTFRTATFLLAAIHWRKYLIPSDLRSQAPTGLVSTEVSDDSGTLSVASQKPFFIAVGWGGLLYGGSNSHGVGRSFFSSVGWGGSLPGKLERWVAPFRLGASYTVSFFKSRLGRGGCADASALRRTLNKR